MFNYNKYLIGGKHLFQHQTSYLERFFDVEKHYISAEMRVGKTLIAISWINRLVVENKVDGVIFVAPKTTHSATTLEVNKEIFNHNIYSSEKSTDTKILKMCSNVEKKDKFFLITTYESVRSKKYNYFYDLIKANCARIAFVFDESDILGNENKTMYFLRSLLAYDSKYVRLMSGTGLETSIEKVYYQMAFIFNWNDYEIKSYYNFLQTFAYTLGTNHSLVRAIKQKQKALNYIDDFTIIDPQKKGEIKNIELYKEIISKHAYTIKRKDILVEGGKVYYKLELKLNDKELDDYKNVTMLDFNAKQQQISILEKEILQRKVLSGFKVFDENGELLPSEKQSKHFSSKDLIFVNLLKKIKGKKAIVYCSFKKEILSTKTILKKMGYNVGEITGDIENSERSNVISAFQNGKINAIVANIQAAGVGITLDTSNIIIYYSNSLRLKDRMQSEDRASKLGKQTKVAIIDIVSADFVDDKVLTNLLSGTAITREIMEHISQEQRERVMKL